MASTQTTTLDPPQEKRPEILSGSGLGKMAVIGLVSGAMSGLFGVGGGIVTVPLLVLMLDFDVRVATGTSLTAIIVTALIGGGTQGLFGNVDVANAALVGVPAVAGVLAGTWIQQQIDTRWIKLIFSAVLLIVAIRLVVG